jgi:hypothetical protein
MVYCRLDHDAIKTLKTNLNVCYLVFWVVNVVLKPGVMSLADLAARAFHSITAYNGLIGVKVNVFLSFSFHPCFSDFKVAG